jgi:hypothetical protein
MSSCCLQSLVLFSTVRLPSSHLYYLCFVCFGLYLALYSLPSHVDSMFLVCLTCEYCLLLWNRCRSRSGKAEGGTFIRCIPCFSKTADASEDLTMLSSTDTITSLSGVWKFKESITMDSCRAKLILQGGKKEIGLEPVPCSDPESTGWLHVSSVPVQRYLRKLNVGCKRHYSCLLSAFSNLENISPSILFFRTIPPFPIAPNLT